jgi:hypothetical protein
MRRGLLLAFLLFAPHAPARAQQSSAAARPALPPAAARRIVVASRVRDAIAIDGRLDEPRWAAADEAADFVQLQPAPGMPASQRTIVRVLYDDGAVYVGARLLDSAPDSIVARLARRDELPVSDWFRVMLDSYFDRRTGFAFTVNPRGVKVDAQYSDDVSEDTGWDAVWEAATTVDSAGWTAEFRIPLSQLRFSASDGGRSVWGVNFRRYVARRDEIADWSPVPSGGGAYVSRAGDLHGLRDLAPARRIEVQPYVLAGATRAPGDAADPFYNATALTSTMGADLRLGVTSDLTLSATVNPDFGQIEADPSVVNLSGFETFFPERRPFFLEGAEIFRPAFPAFPAMFHSRRVGRTPQGGIPGEATYTDTPEATTILAAAKLTGKTAGGWSVGLFDAVTAPERARFTDPAGVTGSAPVEPLTNYGAWRVARDFGPGRSTLGLLATTTNRSLPDLGELDFLPSSAYVLGVDGAHRFANGTYQVAGSLFGSRVAGAVDAVNRIQRSPVHRINRADADHVVYDPTRTSLAGYSANVMAEKREGHWRFWVEGRARSPGFEANDLGFLGRADQASGFARVWYNQFRPGPTFRRWRVDVASWTNVTFGGERLWTGAETWAETQFHNRWVVAGGGGYDLPRWDVDALRGGPAVRADGRWWSWVRVASDPARSLKATAGGWMNRELATGGWSASADAEVEMRPSDRLSLTLGPSLNRAVNPWQFVANRAVDDGTAYVRGRLDQTTVSLTLRAAYTFTPELSLQAYAQPFVSAGAYGAFSRVSAPRAESFAERFTPYGEAQLAYDAAGDTYGVDANGDGETDFRFGNPDFTFRELRSNVVLRWEYRPGSALFVVWSQGRSVASTDGRFRLGSDLSELFRAPGTNTLTVKLAYWIAM